MNYKLNEAKMFADITEGTAIVIDSLSGIYYGMNGYGTSVFENLLAGCSEADILAVAQSLPGAPADLPGKHESFIRSLVGFDILIPCDGASAPVSLPAETAAADGFIPTCTEYKDVQELLYADPIHEVEEEKGWTPE